MTNTSKERSLKSSVLKFSAFIITATVAVFLVFVAINYSENKNTIGAELAYVDGSVEYKESDGGWFNAESGTSLKEGYSVRTLDDSKAIINIDDGSAIRLDANSEIKLTSMNPDDLIIDNEAGNVYSRVTKADRDFTVQIDDYKFQSLGTAYITINTDDEKGVKVYEDNVKVLYEKGGEEKEVTAREGEQYYIKSDKDTEKITAVANDDEFTKWNKERDDKWKEDSQKEKEEDENTEEETGTVSASGIVTDTGMTINWSVEGVLDISKGFKIAYSSDTTAPVYPGDKYVYVSNSSIRTTNVNLEDGETYNFRVCRYTGGACDHYSQVITLTAPEKQAPQVGVISATGERGQKGIHGRWTVEGDVNPVKGFKIAYSSSDQTPTYPGNSAVYISNPEQRSHFIEVQDGKRYYIRVCRYIGGDCDYYSSTVMITAPTKPAPPAPAPSPTKSITLSAVNVNTAGSYVTWNLNFTSTNGFKVVWSKNAWPTYPTRSGDKYQYYSNSSQRSHYPSAFSGAGTYYVRVCEYLGGGKCGIYSNQVAIILH